MESIEQLAQIVPDLTIEVPDRSKHFSLDLEELPAVLAADIKNWLAVDQGTNHSLRRARRNRTARRPRKPIRSTMAESYLRHMLQFITMETRAGVPLESIPAPFGCASKSGHPRLLVSRPRRTDSATQEPRPSQSSDQRR